MARQSHPIARKRRSKSTGLLDIRQLRVEPLECRALLSIRTWDGGGADALWSTPQNWVGDVAPQQDDSLVFPAGVAQKTAINDYANGARFRSLTISDAGYRLNEKTVDANEITLLDGLAYNAVAVGIGAQVNVPIALGAAQTFFSANVGAGIRLGRLELNNLQLLTLDGRGDFDVEGVVSGTGGITKYGDGTLILAGNNTFEGAVAGNQGAINLRHNNALGAATAGTIMGLGTALQLQGNITVPENIAIRDAGYGSEFETFGAIRSVGGTNELTGTISMTNHGSFGVDASSYLTVSGQIMVLPGVSDGGLAKFGAGTLELAGTGENVITGQTTVVQGTLVLNKDRSGTATPMPFLANLVIGDNRDGVPVGEAAKVVLQGRSQIPDVNWQRTGVTSMTIYSTGTLDLNGYDDQVGNLTMWIGRSSAAQVMTGAGTLSLLGDVTVSGFQGSSGASPAATISGKLDLGVSFTGAGGTTQRNFNIGDTALGNIDPDLIISAVVSGVSYQTLTKSGGGTLLLSGANTYAGQTRITAGVLDIGNDKAFGNSSLVELTGGTNTIVRAVNASDQPYSREIANPITVDGDFSVFGSGCLTFLAPVTLTASRTINIVDPDQVTTFEAGVGEGMFTGAGLTKRGRGELAIAGPSTFTGALSIGSSNSQEAGTVRFVRDGALLNNFNTITVNQGGDLILDNTATRIEDRLPDQAAITLTGGTLKIKGHSSGTAETVGPVALSGNTSNTIESDGAVLTLFGFTRNAGSTVNFVGTNAPLAASGSTQINLSGSLSLASVPALTNGILPWAVIGGPSGLDFATYTPGTGGFSLTALPVSAYVASFDAVPAGTTTALVKLSANETITSKQVYGLLLGPGVTLSGQDVTTTLALGGGPLLLSAGTSLSVPFVGLPAETTVFTAPGTAATVNSVLTGAATSITKGGAGTLILASANQFSGTMYATEGVLNVRNSAALGAPTSGTTVSMGAQLQIEGSINVLAETLTAYGMGPNNDGVVKAVSGDSLWAGTFNLGGVNTMDGTLMFPNSGALLPTSGGVNVALDASLNFSGVTTTSVDLIKLGKGILELSGSQANTITNAPRIKEGTLFLNKAPGVTAYVISNGNTVYVGDDTPGTTATLRLGADNQMLTQGTINFLVAGNGTLDLNGHDQIINNLTLEVTPVGGAAVNIGGGTFTVAGDITVQSLGGGNSTGAVISGGTLALDTFNDNNTAYQRIWRVNDGATGLDLTVSSAIVDGTGYRSGGIAKGGFGQLRFDGSASNTYTGTTTVNEGVLQLNKSGGAQAMQGPLVVGDNSLQSGDQDSDVVLFLQDNQLPDWQAAVTVNGTGLLDLNGHSDAIGMANGQTALTVTSGDVRTGTLGTLTINGDIVTNSGFGIGTLPGTYNARVAATISGNIAFSSGYARTITVNDTNELMVEVIFSANLSSSADVLKQGNGSILLSGNNSGLTGTLFINGNPGYSQPGTIVGSDTALGSGWVYPANTVQLGADGGPRTLANRFVIQDLRLAGGNDLTLAGAVDTSNGSIFTVFAPVNFTLAGGLGEENISMNVTKGGPGFLNLDGPSTFSGSLTINPDGGVLALRGGGTLPNVSAITVCNGGTLVLDNTTTAYDDRVRNATPITLSGGTLEFRGSQVGPVSEVLGNITLSTTGATTGSYTSTVIAHSQGQATTLTANSLTRNANTFVSFRGYGADLGTTNRLFFYTPLTAQLVNGILPFATLASATLTKADLDFAAYDVVKGLAAFASPKNTLAGATGKDNVKLTAGSVVSGATTVNALLIRGSGIAVAGTDQLLIGSGLLASSGVGNSIAAPLNFGGATAAILVPDFVSTAVARSSLALNGAIDGQQGLAKSGFGQLTLGGNNAYAGITNVLEGTLRITNSAALGIAANNNVSQGTVVALGAALELDGSGGPLNVQNEYLSIGGAGFGYSGATIAQSQTGNLWLSGNTGALRNVAGNNIWNGRVDLIGRAQFTNWNNITAIGVDQGTFLAINGQINGTQWVSPTKVGLGTLEFGGPAANILVAGTAEFLYVNEGTLQLNKPAGVAAIAPQNASQCPVVVGDNVGGPGADVLRWMASDQIADNILSLTVRGSGLLDLNGKNETLGVGLVLENNLTGAAQVTTGAGTLTLNNNSFITVNNGQGFGSLAPVTVSGNLALNTPGAAAATRTFVVNDGIAETDLRIDARITDGDGNANLQNILFQPTGTANTGRMEFRGDNDFSGTVTLNQTNANNVNYAVRLRVSSNGALGAYGAGAGTIVNGGTLELNGVTITDEPLSFAPPNVVGAGGGFAGRGSLVGVAGTSSQWKQVATPNLITLGGSQTVVVGVDAGATIDLTAALTGSQSLTKLLPGTLRLSGTMPNTMTGDFIVIEGTLKLAKSAGVDAIAAQNLRMSWGSDQGPKDSHILINEAGEQINPGATIYMTPPSLWDLGGFTETVGNGTNAAVLNLYTGQANSARIRNGTLVLGGAADSKSNIAIAAAGSGGGGNSLYSTPGVLLDSDLVLDLGGKRRDINIATAGSSGFFLDYLRVDAKVQNGQINMLGPGVTGAFSTATMTLTNPGNSYAGFSEVQSLPVTTDGNLKITYRGVTTGEFNSTGDTTGSALKTFLENNLLGAGNVSVGRNGAGTPYTITFTGALANRDLPLLGLAAGTTGPVAVVGTVTETTIGGGTLLSGGTIAVGSNGALGTSGVSARSIGNNTAVTLRTDNNDVVLPNYVDVNQGANAAGWFVLYTYAQRPQALAGVLPPTFTYSKSVNIQYTVGTPHLMNFGPTIDGSPTILYTGTGAGDTAIDLGNMSINFRNYAGNITSVTGNIIDSPGTSVQAGINKQSTGSMSDGMGTLILAGNNAFDGPVTVGATGGGVVRAMSNTALGAVNAEVQTFGVTSTGGGSFSITWNNQTTAALNFTGTIPPTADAVRAALNSLPMLLTADGAPITVTSSNAAGPSTVYTVTFGGQLAGFDQAAMTINVAGAVTVNSALTTTLNSSSVTVNAGGVLEIGSGLAIAKGLVLNGLGINGLPTGALRMVGTGGTTTLTGELSLPATSAIGTATGTKLTLGGSGFVTGPGGLIKVGGGTLEMAGGSGNNYTGTTVINEGTLLANKQNQAGWQFQPNAIGWGALTIGNEAGGNDADIFRYGESAGIDQILGTVNALVTSSGLLDLNGKSDFINYLTLETSRFASADVQTGAGTLTVSGDVVVNTFGATDGTAPPAAIGGNLNFMGGTWSPTNAASQFIVNDTFVPSTNNDLVVSAAIGEVQAVGGFVPGLQEGRVAGTALNTGTVNPKTSLELFPRSGSTSQQPPWGGNETWVYTGKFFTSTGIVSVGGIIDDTLWIAIDGTKVLQTTSYNISNTSGPVINLGANTWHDIEIRVFNGGGGSGATNTVNGWIANVFGVGINPAGTIVGGDNSVPSYGYNYLMPVDNGSMNLFKSQVSATPFALTKAGMGTMTLAGASTYTGATTVNAGILILGDDGGVQSSPNVIVNAGTTLVLDNTARNANRLGDTATLTLAGGTLWFKGNALAASTETVGTLTLAANTASTLRVEYAAAGQALTFTASAGNVLNRNAGATLNLMTNDDFVFGKNEVRFVATGTATLPALAGGILPYVTVTTYLGRLTAPLEAVDLTGDLDGDAATLSLGKLATYDASNVKVSGTGTTATLGDTINALLIVGDRITVTVPGGGTTVTSGQIVNLGGVEHSENVIDGGTLNVGAEPLFFVRGALPSGNYYLTIPSGGTTGGYFTLSLPYYGATASPTLAGAGPAAAMAVPTTVALPYNASAADVQAAIEALPNVGPGNVQVSATSTAGQFAIVFVAALAGGPLPALRINPFFTGTNMASGIADAKADGTLWIKSKLSGGGAARKERRGRLVLAGDNDFGGALVVNEGVVTIQHNNALGSPSAGTTVNSGAALEIQGSLTVAEPLTLSGTGYGNDNSGAVRSFSDKDTVPGNSTLTGTVTFTGTSASIGVGFVPYLTLGENTSVRRVDGLYRPHDASYHELGTAADTLTLSGVVAFNATSNFKFGDGTLQLSGGAPNTGGGTLYVNSGKLLLNKTGGNVAVPGSLQVGDNDGGLNADLVVYSSTGGTNEIADGSNVTLYRSAQFDYNSRSDTINQLNLVDGLDPNQRTTANVIGASGGALQVNGGLNMTGGKIDSGAGTLTVINNATVNIGNRAEIAGNLNIVGTVAGAQRNYVVNDGPELYDLVISANINGYYAAGPYYSRFEKQGTGGLLLTGNNVGLTGSNESDKLSVPSTVAQFVFSMGGATSAVINNTVATDAAVQAILEAMPSIGVGNVIVTSGGAGTNPRVYDIKFQNVLGGMDVPDIGAIIVAGSGTITPTNNAGVWALTVNGGLLGLGTDVPATGGMAIYNADGQLFAEGGPRTVKWLHIDGNKNFRLGSRRDFGAEAGNNYPLYISGGQIWNNTGINNLIIDDPLTPVQIGGVNAKQLVSFPSLPTSGTWGLTYTNTAGVTQSCSLNYNASAAQVRSALEGLTNIGTNNVDVDPGPGPYSFIITFKNALGNQDIRPLTIAVAGGMPNPAPNVTTLANTAFTLARGGGALVERLAGGVVQKDGYGTLTLGGNNTYSGATNVNRGVLKVVSGSALGQTYGTAGSGTVVASGAALQVAGNVTIGNEYLSITGAGYVGSQSGSGYNTGALYALPGSNSTWGTGGTPMFLNSNPTTIGVDAGGSLILNSQIGQTSTGANNNALVKVGAGTLEFQGALPNTYFGTTTINEGTLRLNKRPGATSGLVYIVGDNVGAPGSDVLELASAEQIFDNQQHTIQSTGVMRTAPFAAASSNNEVQQLSVYGTGGTFTVTAFGSTTAALPYNIAPSGGTYTNASLQNALNALATKPANIEFVVSGTPGSYTIIFVDSISPKANQAALVAVGTGGATTSVATLIQGGTNLTAEEQYINTGTAAWVLNFGGVATASTAQSNPTAAQQALEALATIGVGGVVVTGYSGQQQMLVTFTDGVTKNLGATNVPDLVFTTAGGGNPATGTQGSNANVETLGVGAGGPVLTMVFGPTSSAGIDLAAGTSIALGHDLTSAVRPGLPSTAPGATISGQGSLALLPAFATAGAVRTITLPDVPAADDLAVSAAIVNGSTAIETQTITLAGNPTAGTFTLSGGPLTGPTAAIPYNATVSQVWAAIAPQLSAGVQAVVTLGGSAPNLIYTVTFFNLATNPGTMFATTAGFSLATAVVATTVDRSALPPAGGLTKVNATGATASRLTLSGNNAYTGVTTVSSGFLQAVGNSSLGAATPTSANQGAGVYVNQGAALELNGATVAGMHMQVYSNGYQPGLYDVPITFAQSAGVGSVFGGGAVRAVGSAVSTWAGNIELRSNDGTTRWFSLGADDNSTLVVDGVIYGARADTNVALSNAMVKVGGGTVEYRGASSATISGFGGNPASMYANTTVVNSGTLVLNKPGLALAGSLVIGDTRGGDDADVVRYGTMAGANQVNDGSNVYVLGSGKYDPSTANNYSSEIQLLTFPAGTADNANFTLSLFGLTTAAIAYRTTAATTVTNIQAALATILPHATFTVTSLDALNYGSSD